MELYLSFLYFGKILVEDKICQFYKMDIKAADNLCKWPWLHRFCLDLWFVGREAKRNILQLYVRLNSQGAAFIK